MTTGPAGRFASYRAVKVKASVPGGTVTAETRVQATVQALARLIDLAFVPGLF